MNVPAQWLRKIAMRNQASQGAASKPARIDTEHLTLRAPSVADEHDFLCAVRASRSLHQPWMYPPATTAAFRDYVERAGNPLNPGFLLLDKTGGALAGVININEIVMGSFCSGYLGYYAFAGFARRGLMREGLEAVIEHAFATLGLHRLEANIQPGNAPSLALVRNCGFTREGFSAGYLKIGGRWRDHERWTIVAD